jgi:hypothetical protein
MRITLSALVLLFLMGIAVGCGPTSGEEGDTEETTETTTESDATEEEGEEEEEDKSKRPSPPKQASGTIGNATVTVDYGAPSVKGRDIFGGLIPWGKMWRTGANEATTVEVSEAVSVEGQTLPAGKYGLFTIPNEDKWTIVFNSVWDQWGAYEYDEGKDVLRVEVSPETLEENVEQMEIAVEDGKMVIRWAMTAVPVSLEPAG